MGSIVNDYSIKIAELEAEVEKLKAELEAIKSPKKAKEDK